MTKLQYRGVSYDNAKHQPPASTPVEHAYRGLRYSSSLRHEPATIDPNREFHYRGHVYRLRDGATSA
ncbi:MAG: DUF4278 domain-containing protein [Cyanobium sp.]|jgi:hypothetical protein